MPNDTIYIGFSATKRFNVIGWLIEKFQNAPYSHAYVRIPTANLQRELVYEASGLTVHFIGGKAFDAHHKIVREYKIEVSPETKIKTLQFAIDNLEKPYGGLQLIGMMWVIFGHWFGKRWKNPFPNGRGAYICSELVAEILKELGYDMGQDIDTISPRDIDNYLSSVLK